VWCVTVRYRIVWYCCGQCDVLLCATELCGTAVGSVMCYCALQNYVVPLWAMWCVTVRYRIVSDCYYLLSHFLGAFPKLRKANISFIMSVRPSVLPHGTTQLPIYYLNIRTYINQQLLKVKILATCFSYSGPSPGRKRDVVLYIQ